MIACHAGKTEPVHEKIVAKGSNQYAIPIRGQAGHSHHRHLDIRQRYSILNPLLVQVMALGYHFNFYRNKPLLKKAA